MKTICIYLEPFGLLTLTGGIVYSIGTLILNPKDFRFHFQVLLVSAFMAHVALVARKYLERKFVGERIAKIVKSIRVE